VAVTANHGKSAEVGGRWAIHIHFRDARVEIIPMDIDMDIDMEPQLLNFEHDMNSTDLRDILAFLTFQPFGQPQPLKQRLDRKRVSGRH
jgi:hypothetical protein